MATDRNEYWLVLGSDVFVFDYAAGVWTRDSFANCTALAEVEEARNTILWSAATGTWATAAGSWDDYQATEFPALWAGLASGAVARVDDQTVYDYFAQGSIVDRYVETPDYYLGEAWDEYGTLKRLLLLYAFDNAEPFEVGVSLDRGVTWITQTITPVTAGYSYVDLNCTGHTARFRFREVNADGRFRWRRFQYEFVPAGPLPPP